MSGRRMVSIVLVTIWKGVGIALSLLVAVGMANRFGASGTTDAYFFVRRMVAGVSAGLERGFHLIQVPPLVHVAEQEGLAGLRRRLAKRGWQVVLTSIGVAAFVFVFAPEIVATLAPGFETAQETRAVAFLRILIIVLPIAAFTALVGATMNAIRLFSLPTAARLLPRFFVVGALAAIPLGLSIDAVAWAVVVGTAFMGAVFAYGMRAAFRAGSAEWKLPTSLAGRSFSNGRIAAMLVAQIYMIGSSWVDMAFASTAGIGAIAMLEFAQRMVNVGPGVVTNSVVLVYYTDFAAAASGEDRKLLCTHIRDAMRMSFFMVLPIAAAIWVLGEPLVSIVLEHGAFDPAAARTTVEIVQILSFLLPANAAVGTIVSVLFAMPHIPHLRIFLVTSCLAFAVRFVVDATLVGEIGVIAVPLGALAAVAVLTLSLYAVLTRQVGVIVGLRHAGPFVAIAAATFAATAVVWAVSKAGRSLDGGGMTEIAVLAASLLAGGATYLSVAAMAGLSEVTVVWNALAKKARKMIP